VHILPIAAFSLALVLSLPPLLSCIDPITVPVVNPSPQEADAFSLDTGSDFAALDQVAAEVTATKAAWARYERTSLVWSCVELEHECMQPLNLSYLPRYAEFLSERNELAHREWLSMRDQV
jgi:hypothetical protein